jgi:hypothetical protein
MPTEHAGPRASVHHACETFIIVRLHSIELTSTACRAGVHASHSSLPKAPKHSGHPLATLALATDNRNLARAQPSYMQGLALLLPAA